MRLFPTVKCRRAAFVEQMKGKVVVDIGCDRRKIPG